MKKVERSNMGGYQCPVCKNKYQSYTTFADHFFTHAVPIQITKYEYQADDGTVFLTMKACEDYEARIRSYENVEYVAWKAWGKEYIARRSTDTKFKTVEYSVQTCPAGIHLTSSSCDAKDIVGEDQYGRYKQVEILTKDQFDAVMADLLVKVDIRKVE
jgi:hypothetical protein